MPDVYGLRKPINVVLSEDPEIVGHDEDGSDYIFTDISMSKNSRVRIIVLDQCPATIILHF